MMAGKVGRPKLNELTLTTENRQAILDYISQGMNIKEIAREMKVSMASIKPVFNRFKREVEGILEQDRQDNYINELIESTVKPRQGRIDKMHELLNKTVDTIYENSKDEDGVISALDSGDYALILKLLERDENTIMATGRLQTVKKKNTDSRFFFNKEKLLKVDELNSKSKDVGEEDILIVSNIIKEIEDL